MNNSVFRADLTLTGNSSYPSGTAGSIEVGSSDLYEGRTWIMIGSKYVYLNEEQHLALINTLLKRLGADIEIVPQVVKSFLAKSV